MTSREDTRGDDVPEIVTYAYKIDNCSAFPPLEVSFCLKKVEITWIRIGANKRRREGPGSG